MEAFFAALIKSTASGLWGVVKKLLGKKPLSIEEIKKRTQVLFIDDEPLEARMQEIRDAGWNIRQVSEVKNLESDEIKNADIFFVDYKNVGTVLTPTEEGVGLVKLLKRTYPKKHVIFFSGYAGFIPGHEVHDFADGWIQKNADLYVYVERISAAAEQIYGGR